MGFRYRYDSETNQFAHASGIFVATPEGRLARYFYGIEYPPRDVRLGLIEAADNKIGSKVDQLLLYLFSLRSGNGQVWCCSDEHGPGWWISYFGGDRRDVFGDAETDSSART